MEEQKKENKRKVNKKKVAGIIAVILAIVLVISQLLIQNISEESTSITDPAILRAMTYTQYTDDDGHKQVYVADSVTGEETDTVIENVEFSAFFLQDLDSDGYAESIAGTCNEVGSDSILYMELNVLTEGSLENAVITINADNFYLQTALPADDEIKTNAISSNTSNIYFNTISNGTQKIITGNVRSGDYGSTSGILAALSNNINNYSAVNSVTLTGTYVADDGTKTEIVKTVEFTVDWYNTAVASMPTYIADKENLNQSQDINTAVNEEEGTFTVNIKVGMEETQSKSLLEGAYIYGEIPELNGYEAINVEITGTNVTYTWDEETKEYTAQVLAETDETGNIIQNAYYGVYSSGTYYRYNYFEFSITYPIEAYYAVGAETIVYQLTANGYYMAYNNPNEEFENPVQSNIASGTFITTIERGGGDVIGFDVKVGQYRFSSPKGWVVSKENPLSIYSGYATSDEIEDTYIVTWTVSRGADGTIGGVTIAESKIDEESKTADYFTTSTGEKVSMEDITSNIGIYFSYASNMLGEDGWIKVYDDDTDKLLVTFTNDGSDDTENWNSYSSSSPYYYEESVKHIKVETSTANNNSSLLIYNVKELNDEYITTNYIEDYFNTLSYISSTLIGYALIEDDEDLTYVKTDIDQAYYEAPYAYASIAISESAYSTQETKENVTLTIATNTSAYNQVKWINGSFLIEVPTDIINLEINSVSINNKNVEITNYEQYELDGKTYIKIDTENEEEATYTITINADITPDPRMVTTTESFTLYYYNENAVSYETKTTDTYDINNNLSTEDKVGKSSVNVNLVAPSSLLTSESVTNYDEEGNETVAPNVAEVDKEQLSADINIAITNNYSSTISGIVILGRVPFEGNTYALKGTDLGSTFTVSMTGEIELSEGLTGIIYYSTNETATKDLIDESNGWVTADEVTDWSEIKSYLIDISENVLEKGDSYTFTYNVSMPVGLDYNDVTYSHHAIWFNLDTENGKYATYTEPNKVGIMIAKQYDLELTKYQINTNNLVAGATYKVTDLGTGSSKTATTNSNGIFTISGLYVEREYTLQEIKSPSDYELNSDIITFICSVDDDYNLVLQNAEGNYINIDVEQETEDEDHKLTIAVEDEVKATIKIVKTNEEQEALSNIRFKITGKNYANGKTVTSDSEGQATLSGLSIGETYTIEETRTKDGYYLIQEPIEFTVNSNNDGTYYIEIVSDEENVVEIGEVTYANGIPTLTINIENEEIPTYSLEITKIKENDEETLLKGARYELYSEDTGDYEYLYTGENGTLTFTGLYNYVDGRYITGSYVLKEVIAPEGYSVNDETIEFYVKLNEDGTHTLNITNEENLTTLVSYDDSSDTIKITLEDKPLFTLSKVTAEDNTVTLVGAKFIIYETNAAGDIQDYAKDVNGNYVGEQDENGDYIITTDENGEYSAGLKGGFYVAVEVEAPYGYSLAEDTYFTIEGYDTYKISTVEEFLEFAEDDSTNGLAVELTADLDFTGVDYTPKAEFNGIFIGNGHKISNLTISNSIERIETLSVNGSYTYIYQYAGLFAKSDGGTISGIELENLSIENSGETEIKTTTDYSYFYRYLSGIVGYASNVTITNCYITENSNVNITDENEEEYTYSYLYFGGIAGCLSNSTVKSCYNEGSIKLELESKTTIYAGGIIGVASNYNTIENCYNIGKIDTQTVGDYIYIGGIIGRVYYYNIIENCYNEGNMALYEYGGNSLYMYAGGIIGYSYYNIIENCYNKGIINDDEEGTSEDTQYIYTYIGGIIGYTYRDTIENCYNEGDIINTSTSIVSERNRSRIGGIAGYLSSSEITNCYNIGNVDIDIYGYGWAGGITGDSSGSTGINSVINQCYNEGYISILLTAGSVGGGVGGISGYSENAKILNCYNEGEVYAEIYSRIGNCYLYVRRNLPVIMEVDLKFIIAII